MKIYFTAAISQIKDFGDYYQRMVKALEMQGHTVQADHILNQKTEDIFSETDEEKVDYYKKFLKWLNKADIVFAEASFPSTVHVGHEISLALEKGKPVVVLHKKGRDPVFLQGIVSERLFIDEYNNGDLENVLISAVNYASEQQDTRFNFFISPKHQAYLDWVAQRRKIPRAVFLRRLINDRIKKDPEFS
jgi:hypothetical protein